MVTTVFNSSFPRIVRMANFTNIAFLGVGAFALYHLFKNPKNSNDLDQNYTLPPDYSTLGVTKAQDINLHFTQTPVDYTTIPIRDAVARAINTDIQGTTAKRSSTFLQTKNIGLIGTSSGFERKLKEAGFNTGNNIISSSTPKRSSSRSSSSSKKTAFNKKYGSNVTKTTRDLRTAAEKRRGVK